MPSKVWKKITKIRRSLRRRKSNTPKSNRRFSRKKQVFEPPNSPSSILHIGDIQHHEVLDQSNQQLVGDDEISRLSMPSLVEDGDARVGGVVEGKTEDQYEIIPTLASAHASLSNEKQLQLFESDSSERIMSEENNCEDQVDMEVTLDGSAHASSSNEMQLQMFESDSSERLLSEENDYANEVDINSTSDEWALAENPFEEHVESGMQYTSISEVPAKCMDIIGREVKIRDSLKDPRKRGKIGCIKDWKDSITVAVQCDGGETFGVRIANIEFTGKSSGGAADSSQAGMTEDCSPAANTTALDSASAFPYKSPSEVPGNCKSIIGKNVKVRDSLSDSKKRGKVGTVVAWKTRNTVSLKCEDGQTFGVLLSSINFINHQMQSNIHGPDQLANISLDEESSNRSPKWHSNNESSFVTARMNSVNSLEEWSSRMVVGPNLDTSSENEEVFDNVAVSTEKLTKASPLPSESSGPAEVVQHSGFREPLDVPAKDDYIIGKRVKVRDTLRDVKKRGKLGIVVRWKNKSVVEVTCDDGLNFGIRLENIHFDDSHEPQDISQTVPNTAIMDRIVTKTSLTRSREGQDADIAKPKMRKQQKPRSKRKSQAVDEHLKSDVCADWIAPQNPEAMLKFGGFRIEKLVVGSDKNPETTFLNNILKQRKLIVEVPLSSSSSATELIKKRVEDGNGNTHELVSCKTYTESTGSKFVQRKIAKVIYAQTHGPDLQPFAVDDYLLRLGDFMKIPPRKIAARLELFQSPSNLQIISHDDDSWFQRIRDLGYVGGGFIHEDTLVQLLELAGMGGASARRVTAIQVRIFIPSMGIFKGMLVKKRIRNGAPIELPCSMQKVPQSSHSQRFHGSCIVICRNKVHPSPGSANEYIGRNLLDGRKSPPKNPFIEKIKKPLSAMIFRLWETMGVPKDACDRYKKESILPTRRNHAWLVGVPDPTGCLPPDTVFVPGMKDLGPCDLFVTRCPCYAHAHGKKFCSLTEKPPGMSIDDWDWLNSKLSFGVIIFSNPRPSMMSIPERIANGDLDGDLYLVCWDREIVDCMAALPLQDQLAEDDGKLSVVPSNPNWFNEAQDVMIDNLRFELGHLIGALYKLAERIANESEQKLNDPDALALFEAYNEALEYQKHGRPIRLPRHLIGELKPKLQPFVQPFD